MESKTMIKLTGETDVKSGFGKRTLGIAKGMVNALSEADKLPKTKEGTPYPIELWLGKDKETQSLDRASLTFNTGSSALRYSFDEFSKVTDVRYNANKYNKGEKYVSLKNVETEIKPALLEIIKTYPAPESPAQSRFYNVLGTLNKNEKNELQLSDGREVIDVYASLETMTDGKREGEQYIALRSHTAPDKVYDLNLDATGHITSVVAVDFAQKDADGHPHTEFAPVSKASELIGKEENTTLRDCLAKVLEDKQRTKDAQER